MGQDLRSALLKAGLVSKDKVEKEEKEAVKVASEAAEKDRQWRIYRDKVRQYQFWTGGGPTPEYVKWIAKGAVPAEVASLCAQCGKKGISLTEGIERALPSNISWEEGDNFLRWMDKAREHAREVGHTVLHPLRMEQFLPELMRLLPAGVSVMQCGKCRYDFLKRVGLTP
jgi:hypothetical protein